MYTPPPPIEVAAKMIQAPSRYLPQDLEAAAAALDIGAAEAEVDQLEAERRKLLVSAASDAAIEAVEARLKAANLRAERTTALAEQLAKLIEDARSPERKAALEAKAAAAREAQQRSIGHYVELDRLATRLAELLDEIERDEKAIDKANEIVRAAGRSELVTSTPRGLLRSRLGCSLDDMPPIWRWELDGYRGRRSRHSFARMSDLVEQKSSARATARKDAA